MAVWIFHIFNVYGISKSIAKILSLIVNDELLLDGLRILATSFRSLRA